MKYINLVLGIINIANIILSTIAIVYILANRKTLPENEE